MTHDHECADSIVVESLASWWGALYEWSAGWAPGWYSRPSLTPEQLAQCLDVYEGRTYLKTLDRREWWVPVSGFLGNDWSGEEPPLRGAPELQDVVIHHMIDAEHDNYWEGGGGYCAMMLFDRLTNDPAQVFCAACGQFVSLCLANR